MRYKQVIINTFSYTFFQYYKKQNNIEALCSYSTTRPREIITGFKTFKEIKALKISCGVLLLK